MRLTLERYVSSLRSKPSHSWAYVPPRNISTSAHDWGQVLMFEGKSCSLFGAFTSTVVLVVLIVLIILVYIFNWDWTGLNGYNNVLTATEITTSPQKITRTVCKSQDSVGEISIILRAVPCRKSVFSGRLPTQIPVPNAPTESWDLQPGHQSTGRERFISNIPC